MIQCKEKNTTYESGPIQIYNNKIIQILSQEFGEHIVTLKMSNSTYIDAAGILSNLF